MWIYLSFIGVMGLLRLWEMARSKANRRHHGENATQLKEWIFPFMVTLHSSMFVLIPLELLWRKPTFGGPLAIIALIATFLALVLRWWTLTTMGKSWNVKVVHGPDYPIVSTGPYRYIRHPNYVVVALELLFIPLIYHLYVTAILLTLGNLLILRIRIRDEEAVLAQNPEWVAAMGHKPRFIPGLF